MDSSGIMDVKQFSSNCEDKILQLDVMEDKENQRTSRFTKVMTLNKGNTGGSLSLAYHENNQTVSLVGDNGSLDCSVNIK